MRLLLDTSALIPALADPEALSPTTRQALEDEGNSVYFTPVSIWEIERKVALGLLVAPAADLVAEARASFTELSITAEHGEAKGRFSSWDRDPASPVGRHKDPDDRLIIAQALCEGMTVVTTDTVFAKYGVAVMQPA